MDDNFVSKSLCPILQIECLREDCQWYEWDDQECAVEQIGLALCAIAKNTKLTNKSTAKLRDMLPLVEKVSMDLCESCDLTPEKCNGEAFKNITCPNKSLREALKEVNN